MGNLRSSSTLSLSPPLPQHKNCEVVSPRIHPFPFLDCRLALITPSSSFTFAPLKSSTSLERQQIPSGRDDVSLVIAIHFSNSHTMHDFSDPSCRSHVAFPSPKGDVQGDLSCRLDPHRMDHMGGVSQICRRPQPDARVSDISRSSPGRATTCSIRFPLSSQCPTKLVVTAASPSSNILSLPVQSASLGLGTAQPTLARRPPSYVPPPGGV